MCSFYIVSGHADLNHFDKFDVCNFNTLGGKLIKNPDVNILLAIVLDAFLWP